MDLRLCPLGSQMVSIRVPVGVGVVECSRIDSVRCVCVPVSAPLCVSAPATSSVRLIPLVLAAASVGSRRALCLAGGRRSIRRLRTGTRRPWICCSRSCAPLLSPAAMHATNGGKATVARECVCRIYPSIWRKSALCASSRNRRVRVRACVRAWHRCVCARACARVA